MMSLFPKPPKNIYNTLQPLENQPKSPETHHILYHQLDHGHGLLNTVMMMFLLMLIGSLRHMAMRVGTSTLKFNHSKLSKYIAVMQI